MRRIRTRISAGYHLSHLINIGIRFDEIRIVELKVMRLVEKACCFTLTGFG
jgi:hypothetical protein